MADCQERNGQAEHTVVEWAPFKLKPGVSETELLAASQVLQREFLSKQPGFVKRDLSKLSEGQYVDIVYWENKASANQPMDNSLKSTTCADYFSLMETNENDPNQGVVHLKVLGSYAP
ncbi:MAG: hypothetical protein HC842_07910 [Cytophagales bacterium]|nr:hypothetical protein [Cytophagales bacterium]